MRSMTCLLLAALFGLALTAGSLPAADTTAMKQGTADLKSAGPLAFGPNGLMFVGDPQSAAIFAMSA